MRTQVTFVLLVLCLGVMTPVQSSASFTDFFTYIRHLSSKKQQSPLIRPKHLESVVSPTTADNFSRFCLHFTTFRDVVGCWVAQAGLGLTPERVQEFNGVASSSFAGPFVEQKYYYKYLPQDKLEEYLPKYLSIIENGESYVAALADEIRSCENGFFIKLLPSDKDKNDEEGFRIFTNVVGVDCRNQEKIEVFTFAGSRRGWFRPDAFNEKSQQFVQSFCQDTLLYIVNKHFGTI